MTHRPQHIIYVLLLLLTSLSATAQEYASSFNTLRLPSSSHAAALGGQSVSLIESNPSLGWSNPALYTNAADKQLMLNCMTYAAGSLWMGAHFTKAFGERHTMAVGAQMMNYGSMNETDESGRTIGKISAKDFVIGGGYSYLLSDRWSGGANAKLLVSNLAGYSALAVALDVGLNYYDEEQDLSLSAAMQNVGVQVKAYQSGVRTHLPFTLAFGFSKGMAHLPIRVHVTLNDLTRWKKSYFVLPDAQEDGKSNKVSAAKMALNHLNLGIDILPTDNIYLALGYNFRRAYELKASGSSHWAGISAGAGLNIKRFQFGVSFAKYHQAGNSFMFNAGYTL